MQPTVKLVGKFLAVGLAERGGASGDLAGIAHFFHKVAHGKALANIFFGESLAARVEHVRAFFDGFGSQGDVLGDHQIACLHLVNDVVVGHVETLGYLPAFDVRARGQVNGVVGDEESVKNDSFEDALLEHPQYTRPEKNELGEVPEILLSGNHDQIEKWKRKHSLGRTFLRRQDLIRQHDLNQQDMDLIREFLSDLGYESDRIAELLSIINNEN